jgi:hypothetical protein
MLGLSRASMGGGSRLKPAGRVLVQTANEKSGHNGVSRYKATPTTRGRGGLWSRRLHWRRLEHQATSPIPAASRTFRWRGSDPMADVKYHTKSTSSSFCYKQGSRDSRAAEKVFNAVVRILWSDELWPFSRGYWASWAAKSGSFDWLSRNQMMCLRQRAAPRVGCARQ